MRRQRKSEIAGFKPDGRPCKHCGSTNTTKSGCDAWRCQDCWNLTFKKMTGIELIAQERQEQIEKHSRTVEEDANMNYDDQLSFAASCLAFKNIEEWDPSVAIPSGWSPEIWAKMIEKPHKERLIIAGALIAAELDRIEFMKQLEADAS